MKGRCNDVRQKPMHDTPDQTHWHEPKAGENAGFGKFLRKPMPYDSFMEAEGVPVFRGIGVKRVQDLPMKPWARLGGRGSYIQLYGTEGLWGMYVVEIPGAGALNAERHLYEKVVLVVEGRGTTEVWQEGQTRRHSFEWQRGSLFTIPLNAFHRFVNAASSPAILLCGTSAPNVMNLLDNPNFIFNCPHNFTERFSGADDYFKPNEDIEPDPVRGLAMRRTNLIPDVINCELPLDNRRSPGYRRVEPHMAGNRFYLFVGQHETGRYAKAHKHHSTAVLICVEGKGYTYTWPDALGTTPWQDGRADKILRQDYEPVGIVSAAPAIGSTSTSVPAGGRCGWSPGMGRTTTPRSRPAAPARRWPISGRSISTREVTRSRITWKIRRSAPNSMRRCVRKASRAG
jgi:quercetin dioxygenase-like cupin family protein